MILWKLPPIPGFSLFLFAACAIILVFGIIAYVMERRKEIKKEKALKTQSKLWASS